MMGGMFALIVGLIGFAILGSNAAKIDDAKVTAAAKHPAPVIMVTGLMGVDVSEYDEIVDWPKLMTNKDFVIIRASHGEHHDATYVDNMKEAKALGKLRGAYHYVVPTDNYADQLRYFVNTVKLEPGDLRPVLDLEKPELWKLMKAADRLPYVLKWATALERVYGVKPIIYMSPSFIDDVLGGAQNAQVLKDYPLWVANYKVALPWIPLPWSSYIIWQYSESAICDGIIHGPCDLDVAPLTLAELQKWTVTQAGGGDDKVLTAQDLDDGGMTPVVKRHFVVESDSQHGRTHKPKHHGRSRHERGGHHEHGRRHH